MFCRGARRILTGIALALMAAALTLTVAGRTPSRAGDSAGPGKMAAGSQVADFAGALETIRQTLKIPGMSAAVLRRQEIIFAQGFGYADLENEIAATPDTPYGLASVTKPIAAVLIMQLVEEALIDLDDPIVDYGVRVDNSDAVTIRHLLTHTSEGTPGAEHRYNGGRYGLLGGVMEAATGQSFTALLAERISYPLHMQSTALNPIVAWGGVSSSELSDFKHILGWGEANQHTPDVYAWLARPYQFDEAYNIIPGMYQLYGNPGAGMISSVNDLARFDIALDQGQLLAESSMAEMLAPAVSTYQGRADLMYGLGWYIQEFDDLRLIWHAGRWPPSTSALYLKIPDLDLTFIVLANTANLTTPFDGIGYGDVSKSALALAFFRHFVYPQRFDAPLPVIDWEESEGALVAQLAGIEDAATRQILERELWAFRQMAAAAGRNDPVNTLWRVDLRAFPQSRMRHDSLFTHTTGAFPPVPPVLSAWMVAKLARGIFVWFALLALSLLMMAVLLARRSGLAIKAWGLWLLGTLILGPFALLIFHFTRHSRRPAGMAVWRQALGAALVVTCSYIIAWFAVITSIQALGIPQPLLILGVSYLVPLAVDFTLFRWSFLLPASGRRIFGRLKMGLLAEFISLNIALALLFPLTMILADRVLTTLPGPGSPYLWAILSLLALATFLVQFPLNVWLVRVGWVAWLAVNGDRVAPLEHSYPSAGLPLAASMFIFIASIAITVSQVA